MKAYEKLGAFYLGRRYDPACQGPTEDLVLYDSRDLTTHAVCVGMTGSGKTGLCLGLLEEAALDGIPVLAVDPKGDLGNLLLTFPELDARDFRAWIDPDEAARKGRTPEEHARATADLWRSGLASWDQDGARIRRFEEAAERVIYTPGSTSGLPLNVLRSLDAPPEALRADADALRERIEAAVSGLLALLGIEADPLRSREHILLASLLDHAWRRGESLSIAQLIQALQSPPFQKVGVLDLESFFPARDRFDLAMTLNNLLASPGFAAWMEGEPLEIQRLLWTPEGLPRISVLSIAHLPEAQRMFFVTVLLNELVAWMRTQPGTSSLRAILYMDEVFGYFPPVAEPPSKRPMLTLLKQARAYGLGCVLATQNPVDLDYKGLSNAGTWFLGRLQTERDKERVMDGLEGASAAAGGASAAAGGGMDRDRLERTLSGLRSRVFLLHNVHEDEPVLFHTRWVLSYLRGPLTRAQIQTLMEPVKGARRKVVPEPLRPGAAPKDAGRSPTDREDTRPVLPPEVREVFLAPEGALRGGDRLLYRPALLGRGRLHFADGRSGLDHWEERILLAHLEEGPGDPWEGAVVLGNEPVLDGAPDTRGEFAALPSRAARENAYGDWEDQLEGHLYRGEELVLWRSTEFKETSRPGESQAEFRSRLAARARERRDLEVEKLRRSYAKRFERLRDRIRTAEHRVQKEESQYSQQKMQAVISVGATVLGALLGRKTLSSRNVGRATTAARGAARTAREKGDIGRAREKLETLREELEELEERFEEEAARVRERWDPTSLDLEERRRRPRKSDLGVEAPSLAWTPWRVDPDGIAEPLWRVD